MAAPRPHRTTRYRAVLTLSLLIALLVVSCQAELVPTQTDIRMAQTADYLTQNAPPPQFQRDVSFAPIDRGLDSLPHWHYEVTLRFNGILADTRKPASGSITAQVYSNQVSGERRVVITAQGDVFDPPLAQVRTLEGVRLGNNFYFVNQNGTCQDVTSSPDGQRIAKLTAGDLIGGIRRGNPLSAPFRLAEGNPDLKLWQYTFVPSALDAPEIQIAQGGRVEVSSGDLWFAPSLNAVYSYSVTLKAENVIVGILRGDRQLIGEIQFNYRLLEQGTPYNIAIPFGC